MIEIMAGTVVRRRRFTADEYHRMAEAGILHEDDRIELIDGEIMEMAAIGGRHAACVNDLTELFVTRLAGRAIVSVQNPVRLSSHAEPEPDLLLLRPRPDRYREALPDPGDVLLLIEVSDTTLPYDRQIKLPRYAAAGIPEVWIVDLAAGRVLVHRQPTDDLYREARVIDQGALSPVAFPDIALRLEEFLG